MKTGKPRCRIQVGAFVLVPPVVSRPSPGLSSKSKRRRPTNNTMSSEGNAVATPAVDLDDLRTRINQLGESIKQLKSSAEPDKDAITAAVNALLDAKRTFANNNGGIGVDGNKWEEPMSKKDKKKAEKAVKAAAGATGGDGGEEKKGPSKKELNK